MAVAAVSKSSRICVVACSLLASAILAGAVVGLVFGLSSGVPTVFKNWTDLDKSADVLPDGESIDGNLGPGNFTIGSEGRSSSDLVPNNSSSPAHVSAKPSTPQPTPPVPEPPVPEPPVPSPNLPASAPVASENKPSAAPRPQPHVLQVKGSWRDKPRTWRYQAQAKRGICWQFDDWKRERAMAPFDRISWTKNWKLSPDMATAQYFADQGIEFVPMLWSKYTLDDMEANIPKDARYLLVLNEPNHIGQAATWPKEAAAMWPKIEAVARSKGLLVGSPSVSPCGSNDYIAPKYADPFVWMDDFLDHCKGCKMDFIAVHYYVCNLDWLKGYLYQFYRRYNLPVWLTEFACPFGDPLRTKALLEGFMEWADAQPWLHRYSWFTLKVDDYVWLGGGNNLMDYDQLKLTPLGYTYNSYTGSKVASSSVQGESVDSASSNEVIMSWSEGCGPCAALLSNATSEDKAFCSFDCGFWDRSANISKGV